MENPEELQHFVHLRHLSEAALVLGSAYARAGEAADARAGLEESRSAANKIIAVADVQQSLRDEAKQFVSVIDRLEKSLPK